MCVARLSGRLATRKKNGHTPRCLLSKSGTPSVVPTKAKLRWSLRGGGGRQTHYNKHSCILICIHSKQYVMVMYTYVYIVAWLYKRVHM